MNYSLPSAKAPPRLPKWVRVTLWIFGGFIALQVVLAVITKGMAAKYGGNEALQARIQMRGFAMTLAMRKAAGLPYPTSVQGLDSAFQIKSQHLHLPKMSDLPLEERMKDPWGRSYAYYSPGKHNLDSYDLCSLGADGIEGTPDDITNW